MNDFIRSVNKNLDQRYRVNIVHECMAYELWQFLYWNTFNRNSEKMFQMWNTILFPLSCCEMTVHKVSNITCLLPTVHFIKCHIIFHFCPFLVVLCVLSVCPTGIHPFAGFLDEQQTGFLLLLSYGPFRHFYFPSTLLISMYLMRLNSSWSRNHRVALIWFKFPT